MPVAYLVYPVPVDPVDPAVPGTEVATRAVQGPAAEVGPAVVDPDL